MSSQQVSLLLVIIFVVLEYTTITIAISRLRRRVRKIEVATQPKDEQVLIAPLGLDFSNGDFDTDAYERSVINAYLGKPDLNGDIFVGQAAETINPAYVDPTASWKQFLEDAARGQP